MLTEVKDIYAIHIIIYYIDGGEMEREGREGEDGRVEDGRVEDTGGGRYRGQKNYYCPVKLSFLILKFTGQ